MQRLSRSLYVFDLQQVQLLYALIDGAFADGARATRRQRQLVADIRRAVDLASR